MLVLTNLLRINVFRVKTKKIQENENTSKKYMSIVFENKDLRVDFFSAVEFFHLWEQEVIERF